MNEEEYLLRFNEETPKLEAWGKFIISKIDTLITERYGVESYKKWIKITPSIRIKDSESLISKAFILNRGWFNNIYDDITDKVGVRYVVGLTGQIEIISRLIKECDAWSSSTSKEFDAWRDSDPRIFDYQSAHHILSAIEDLEYNSVVIPLGTTCEVQIRTLIQHAYAELSHDTLYKSNITKQPEVHRLFAKSMALMETTDDMLSRAKATSDRAAQLVDTWREKTNFLNRTILSEIDFNFGKRENDYIIDKLSIILDNKLLQKFESFVFDNKSLLSERVKDKQKGSPTFRLSSITLIYFLSKAKRFALPREWPLDLEVLEKTYSDLGISPTWSSH